MDAPRKNKQRKKLLHIKVERGKRIENTEKEFKTFWIC